MSDLDLGHALYRAGYTRTVWEHQPDATHRVAYRFTGPFAPDAVYDGSLESAQRRWGVSLHNSVVKGNTVGERASLDGLQSAIASGLLPGLPPTYRATQSDLDDIKVLTRNGVSSAYDDLVPEDAAPVPVPSPVNPPPTVDPGPTPGPVIDPVDPPPVDRNPPPGPTPGPVIEPTDPPPTRDAPESFEAVAVPADVLHVVSVIRGLHVGATIREGRLTNLQRLAAWVSELPSLYRKV